MVLEILPPVVIAFLATIVDTFFMIKDETGDAKKILGHGVGSFLPLLIFSFVAFNLSFVTPYLSAVPFLISQTGHYIIIAGIALIAAIFARAKSAVFGKGAGSHEKFSHALLVGAIVAAGPLAWPYIQPYVQKYLPF